ncbi:MAG: hypothetical protein IT531_11290 [Burkholderiales bacterium]|nr:hypothetical protein [Burkholderiales bacterium]
MNGKTIRQRECIVSDAVTGALMALVAATLLLSGCAHRGYRDAGEELSAFAALAENPQVRHAPGAERYARRVAAVLPAAVAQVERFHYRAFATAPVVYVCGDDACFHRFVAPSWNYTAAVVYDNRLVLAPRLFDREPERLTPILLHELSHLHLGQYRGHYTMDIPVWFHEGLASLVALGGGADLATDDEAWAQAVRDRHFRADQQHLPWTRKMARTWGTSVSVFYRQAMLYLADLRSNDEAAFSNLVGKILDGEAFDAAFAQSFHVNPAHSVLAFFKCLHHDSRRVQGPCANAREAAAGAP